MISREPDGSAAQFGQNLLIISGVQLVLRLQLSQLQIIVASFLKVPALHTGMREQFVEFGDVSGVAGLLREIKQDFQGGNILAHVSDQRMQAFENLCLSRWPPGDRHIAGKPAGPRHSGLPP